MPPLLSFVGCKRFHKSMEAFTANKGESMKHIVNAPLSEDVIKTYLNEGLLEKSRCDGFELIWAGEECDVCIPKEKIIGWHLTFYTDWLDFWLEDKEALMRKFGSERAWQEFYGGKCKEDLVRLYREDFIRARDSGAQYGVFHVCDASMEEWFGLTPLHSERQIVEQTVRLINEITGKEDYGFTLLFENMSLNGLTLLDKDLIGILFDGVEYKNKGIMLDTGHLMCTNLSLDNEKEGVRYIERVIDSLGEYQKYIKGIHLNMSLPKGYAESFFANIPKLPKDIYKRFEATTEHLMKLDRHMPWTYGGIAEIINRIKPLYLVHEIRGKGIEEKIKNINIQINILEGKVI